MKLNGEISVAGPGLVKRLVNEGEAEFEEASNEFILKASNSEKEKVHFDVYIEMDEDDVSFCVETGNGLTEYLHLIMKGSQSIALTLSLNQAQTLKKILENYVDAWNSFEALKGQTLVKAKSA